MDFCSVLFIVVIVVGIVAVLGHGIWLLIAAVFEAVFGFSSKEAAKPIKACARCARSLPAGRRLCPNCGLDSDSPMSAELAELAATRRQLDRLVDSGQLAPELREQVFQSIGQRQQTLLGRSRPEPAQRIPAAPVLLATRAVEIPLPPAKPAEEILDVIPVLEEPRPLGSVPPRSLTVAALPRPPRRSLGEVLSAFMEERNILWGELIGGLLIVGCSIALVISLWQQLEQIPYFPFLVLAGITAALIGAGLYTLHHWKLESTSRGLLVIGTLLVPLSFMVLAGLARGPEGNRLLEFGVTAASLGLFAFLLQRAGRVLAPEQSGLLPLAVLGAAASQLLIPWLLAKHQPVLGPILFLGALPLLCQAATAALALHHASRREPIEPSHFNALFGLLGMATFSFAVAMGFLVYWNENLTFALQRLAVVTAAGSIAPLVCGAWSYRRLTDEPRLATARTIGTAIALAGAFVMLVAVGLAWPRPLALAVVCGLNFTVLTIVALRFRMPVAHAVALPCLALGYLTTWHALAGHLSESTGWALLHALGSAQSGTVLAALVVALGVAGELLARAGQRQSSAAYAVGSGIAALVSLALVSARGFADPVQPMAIYALYGAGSLALNWRWRKPDVNYLGLGLLVGATLWGLQWLVPGRMAIWGTMLAVEAIALAAYSTLVALRSSTSASRLLGDACRDTAAVAAALALAAAASAAEFPGPALQAYTAAILAAAVLFLAYSYRREWLTGLAALLLFASLFHAFAWDVPDRPLPRSLAFALLTDTSLVLLASLALQVARVVRPFPTPTEVSDRIYLTVTLPWRQTAWVGSAAVWTWALVSLIGGFYLPALGTTGPTYPPTAPWWAFAPGGLLGWMALALTAAAFLYRGQRPEPVSPLPRYSGGEGSGVRGISTLQSPPPHPQPLSPEYGGEGRYGIALLLVIYVALSTMTWLSPMAGYRTLMVGSAAYALALTLAGMARARRAGTPVELSATAAWWVRVAGLLAVWLGVKAAFWHQDYLWAAGSIALASTAGATTAVGRRQEGWAFAAGLGFDLAASFLVWHFNQGDPLELWWVYLLQANCAASGAGALLWLAARKQLYGDLELKLSASPLLATQNLLGLMGNLAMFSLAFLAIFVAPRRLPNIVDRIGEAGGVLSLLLPMAAALWYVARASLRQRFSIFCLYGLMLGVLAGCAVNSYDIAREWWAYQTVTVSWIGLGMACLGLGLVAVAFQSAMPDGNDDVAPSSLTLLFDSLPHVQRWVEIVGLLVVVLALREAPWRSYEAGGAAAAVSVMAMGMALWSRRQRHVYQFGLLIDLAGVFIWLKLGPHTVEGFLAINVLGLGLAAAFWSVLELALEANAQMPRLRGRFVPFSHQAIAVSLAAFSWLVALGVWADLAENPLQTPGVLPWTALVVAAVASLVTLWDSTARWTGAWLYTVGLLAIGLAFSGQDLDPRRFGWLLALALVGYVGLTSAAASILPRLASWGQRLHIPSVPERSEAAWLGPAQVAVSSVAVFLSAWIALTFEQLGQRLAGPLAVTALLPAGVMLAGRFAGATPGAYAARLALGFRQATLGLFALVLVEFGWALLGPEHAEPLLHRNIILMTVLAAMTLVYSGKLGRLPLTWSQAARRLGPMLGVCAGLLLVAVLVQESMAYNPKLPGVAMSSWAIAVVALGLLSMVVAALRYAVKPGQDPLGLSEQNRQAYVYGGEFLLVLLLAHLRLTMPYLFTGLLAPYYSLIVMGLAFAGVGLAELFQRRNLPVLSEPLARTGLFLPVLPLLAFWLRPTPETQQQMPALQPLFESLSRLPSTYDQYAWLWFLASGVYGLMAFLRRSFRLSLTAALTANFGLWSLYYFHGWLFLAHPQLWLIPLAVVLLVAEQLNRDRLDPEQALGLRYLALGLLYLSSTAEMFITGLSTAWWVPLPLMFLAVAGVLVGILLRVRAYLFLGTGFLVLVIFSMIWNAAVNQQHTWIWWASGIVLGGAILALFAVFEKRRDDVLRMVEQVKGWS